MPFTGKKPTRLLALIVALLAMAVAGCASAIPGLYPPDPVTTEGASTRSLYDIVFVIAAVVFFVVEGFIVFAVIRYRRKPTDTELPPQTHGNNLVEIIWTIIPTVIVLFLFIVSWQALNTVDAVTPTPTVKITAIAQRYSWNFVYEDAATGRPLFTTDAQGDGVFGTMEVPPGVPVEVSLHSLDVIHAFYVPKFLFKRDVVPGQTNRFDFTVDPEDAGQTFRGQCAELCGIGHGGMTFDVHASANMAAYQTWLQGQIDQKYVGPPAGASASPGGSPAAGGSPSPAAGGSASPVAGGTTLQITAQNTAYDKATLDAPAGTPFQIAFTNSDSGTQHNVEIKKPDGSDAFKGQIVTGPTTITYSVPGLPAGTYSYNCTVHPAMTGTLTVH